MEASALPRPKPLARWPGARLRGADDADLVKRVRGGDETAFEVAYDRHHRGILSFCRHMLGSREEAEDAVQHTFIAAYRDLVSSDKRIQLKPWLYTIARNRCLSVLRARREQVALDDVEPATEGLSSQVQRRQDLREMLADLAALPEDQREALVLAEIGALSHEEIAMTLGVRKDKVKALVFQARESLSSSRQARDADCHEIQQQLAVLRGGSLRRTTLRRHVEQCPACAAYKAEVQRQRAAMVALLPVVPTVALKQSVLAASFASAPVAAAGAGAGAAGAGAGAFGATAKGLASKALVAVAVGGSATGAGVVIEDQISGDPPAAIADAAPARIAPDTPITRQRDRGVAPADGHAVPVVASLRTRASDVAAQRTAATRTGGASSASTGNGQAPPPLNASAALPAVGAGETAAPAGGAEQDDELRDKGKGKDRGAGARGGEDKAKGKNKDKGGRANGHKKHGDGDKDHGAGAKDRGSGGSGGGAGGGRPDGSPSPGQAKKDRAAGSAPAVPGTGRKAPKQRPNVGNRVPGGKQPGASGGKRPKIKDRGQSAKGRVPKPPKGSQQRPSTPAAPPQPAPTPAPPAPSREPDPQQPEKLVDEARGTVDSVVKPREDAGKDGDGKDKRSGVVERAKDAVKGAVVGLLPF